MAASVCMMRITPIPTITTTSAAPVTAGRTGYVTPSVPTTTITNTTMTPTASTTDSTNTTQVRTHQALAPHAVAHHTSKFSVICTAWFLAVGVSLDAPRPPVTSTAVAHTSKG